ncbi:hypothetical protein U1Q18_052094, partial [Sarracenia purpurea var. burkii]
SVTVIAIEVLDCSGEVANDAKIYWKNEEGSNVKDPIALCANKTTENLCGTSGTQKS